MENIFPFLIGLAYFAYKIYSNFMQEQEKAQRRNPLEGRPAEAEWPREFEPQRTVRRDEPEPFLIEEAYESASPYEPKYKNLYREERVKEAFREPTVSQPSTLKRVELYNPEAFSEETLRSRAIHKGHGHGVQKREEADERPFEFDFEDAIIKEAILNRPQY